MPLALLSLGSNVGRRAHHLRAALRALRAAGHAVRSTSLLYETEPALVADQPRFLNAVCAVDTTAAPAELLDQLKEIEASMGRDLAGGLRCVPGGKRGGAERVCGAWHRMPRRCRSLDVVVMRSAGREGSARAVTDLRAWPNGAVPLPARTRGHASLPAWLVASG